MLTNKFTGNRGEKTAALYLKKKGYTILDTNFRSRRGELDIVCLKGDTLVFVEVKSRNNLSFGLPREAVTKKKQQSLIYTANYYCFIKGMVTYNVRFDVIEVVDGKVSEHIENAFACN